jgi:hypothetical protein
MVMTAQERIETLEEVLEMMGDCAAKLRSLRNPRIDAYCLADFEGREGGWSKTRLVELGKFVRDYIEEELQEMRRELDESEDDGD